MEFAKQQSFKFLCFALFLAMGHWSFHATARLLDEDELFMREKHKQWITQYGREYKDVFESEKRFHIFKENVKRIEEFNNNRANHGKSYTLGINAFTDMTPEEFHATYTSKINNNMMYFSSNENSMSSLKTNMFGSENLTDLPSSMDWRKRGAVTDIKYQGQCGCCWAFATVAAVEGFHQIQTNKLVYLSEQQLLDCNLNNNGCNGGFMGYAYEYIQQNQGLTSEQSYPYMGTQQQCRRPMGLVTINGYRTLPHGNEEALMQAVSKQPVSVGISVDNNGMWQSYTGGVFDGGCGMELNHAVTIIGYGTDQQTQQDYWLVKNSWGRDWGDRGFMKVLRGDNVCGIANQPSYPI